MPQSPCVNGTLRWRIANVSSSFITRTIWRILRSVVPVFVSESKSWASTLMSVLLHVGLFLLRFSASFGYIFFFRSYDFHPFIWLAGKYQDSVEKKKKRKKHAYKQRPWPRIGLIIRQFTRSTTQDCSYWKQISVYTRRNGCNTHASLRRTKRRARKPCTACYLEQVRGRVFFSEPDDTTD